MSERKTRISAKVREAIRLMVEQGLKRAEAAERAGLKDNSLYIAMRKADVCAFRTQLMEVFRTSAASRSIARVDKLADSAESEHVRYKANELLLGIDGIVPVTRSEQTLIHQGISPGLQIVFGAITPELLEGVTLHPAMRGRVIDAQPRDVALIEARREGKE